jgi:hypothetical protein
MFIKMKMKEVREHTVCAFMPPSTSFHVSLSRPMLPEQNTIPFALIACENTGSGAGAFEVRISVMVVIFIDVVFGYCVE